MKGGLLLLSALVLGAALTGCSGSAEDSAAVPPQKSLNPGGMPQDAQQAAAQKAHQEGGASAERQMAAAAEAMRKNGGK